MENKEQRSGGLNASGVFAMDNKEQRSGGLTASGVFATLIRL
jgi:hypothetical protein